MSVYKDPSGENALGKTQPQSPAGGPDSTNAEVGQNVQEKIIEKSAKMSRRKLLR